MNISLFYQSLRLNQIQSIHPIRVVFRIIKTLETYHWRSGKPSSLEICLSGERSEHKTR